MPPGSDGCHLLPFLTWLTSQLLRLYNCDKPSLAAPTTRLLINVFQTLRHVPIELRAVFRETVTLVASITHVQAALASPEAAALLPVTVGAFEVCGGGEAVTTANMRDGAAGTAAITAAEGEGTEEYNLLLVIDSPETCARMLLHLNRILGEVVPHVALQVADHCGDLWLPVCRQLEHQPLDRLAATARLVGHLLEHVGLPQASCSAALAILLAVQRCLGSGSGGGASGSSGNSDGGVDLSSDARDHLLDALSDGLAALPELAGDLDTLAAQVAQLMTRAARLPPGLTATLCRVVEALARRSLAEDPGALQHYAPMLFSACVSHLGLADRQQYLVGAMVCLVDHMVRTNHSLAPSAAADTTTGTTTGVHSAVTGHDGIPAKRAKRWEAADAGAAAAADGCCDCWQELLTHLERLRQAASRGEGDSPARVNGQLLEAQRVALSVVLQSAHARPIDFLTILAAIRRTWCLCVSTVVRRRTYSPPHRPKHLHLASVLVHRRIVIRPQPFDPLSSFVYLLSDLATQRAPRPVAGRCADTPFSRGAALSPCIPGRGA